MLFDPSFDPLFNSAPDFWLLFIFTGSGLAMDWDAVPKQWW